MTTVSSEEATYWTVPVATVMAAGPSLVQFWAAPVSTLGAPAPRAPRQPRWI